MASESAAVFLCRGAVLVLIPLWFCIARYRDSQPKSPLVASGAENKPSSCYPSDTKSPTMPSPKRAIFVEPVSTNNHENINHHRRTTPRPVSDTVAEEQIRVFDELDADTELAWQQVHELKLQLIAVQSECEQARPRFAYPWPLMCQPWL